MPTRARTILIAEDEPSLSTQYRALCDLAMREVSQQIDEIIKSMPGVASVHDRQLAHSSQILTAFSYAEASAALESTPSLDVVSVDLVLQKQEVGAASHAAAVDGEAKGMAILRELREKHKRTIAVVASGENHLSYAMDALQRYKVIHYFRKPIDGEAYKNTIKAALWYLEAADYIDEVQRYEADVESLEIAELCWRRALEATAGGQPAPMQDLEINFPEDLQLRIQSIRSITEYGAFRMSDELAKQMIKERILHADQWAVFRVGIRNFDEFRQHYPSQVDSLLRFLANITKNTARDFEQRQAFLGLLGQEYVSHPCFLLITSQNDEPFVQNVVAEIEKAFLKHSKSFLTYRDREAIERREKADTSPQIGIKWWASWQPSAADDFPDKDRAIETLVGQ